MNTSINAYTERKSIPSTAVCIALAAAAALLTVISLTNGAAYVDLYSLEAGTKDYSIFTYIRLPRTIACLLSGMALAVSGALLQTTLNNRLASPGIIGVNSGAGLFVVLAAVLLPGAAASKFLFAFAGAFLVVMLVYIVARKTGATRVTLVLAGIVAGSLLSAFSDALVTLFPHVLADKSAFFIGGFSSTSLQSVQLVWPFITAGIFLSLLLSSRLDMLSLGEEVASSLGVRVERCRFLAILAAAVLAAGAVSLAGLIGFVGLVVPNLAHMILPAKHRIFLPFCALAGAVLVLGGDLIARLVFMPFELPVGIVLSVIGAPFFIYILFQKKWRRSYD